MAPWLFRLVVMCNISWEYRILSLISKCFLRVLSGSQLFIDCQIHMYNYWTIHSSCTFQYVLPEVHLSYLYIHFYVTRPNSKGATLLLYYGDKVAKRGSIYISPQEMAPNSAFMQKTKFLTPQCMFHSFFKPSLK